LQFLTKNEQDTQNLGKDFGTKCTGGEVFLLTGELGGGKTQFAKGLARGLAVEANITSPTFNYENIYKGKKGLTLYHFDLYREEVLDPDIAALFSEAISDNKAVVVVEWAERAKAIWPKGAKVVNFKWTSESERMIDVISH
jgi:tRNA threonylcarbamoyladenosine biosynthesis protein TsaE